MSLERRLRDHFDVAGEQLPEPDGRLDEVVRRGRRRLALRNGALATGTAVLVGVAVLGGQQWSPNTVEFGPAAGPASSEPAAGSTAYPRPSSRPSGLPAPKPSDPTPGVAVVEVRDLGAPAFAYGPNDTLAVSDDDSYRSLGNERILAAFPDGRGGVVLQTRARDIVWLENMNPEQAVRRDDIAAAAAPKATVTLRGVDPLGNVVFSTRPEKYFESLLEKFFDIPLEGGDARLLGAEPGYESWYVGPATTSAGRVMASCHLLCSLWPWPSAGGADKPLYHGGGGRGTTAAIEGLSASADGSLLAFVEGNEMAGTVPEVVVVAAGNFRERVRLALPVDAGTRLGGAVVSVSADGQRILVAIDPAPTGSIPRQTFLVEEALSQSPKIKRVGFPGVVQWLCEPCGP